MKNVKSGLLAIGITALMASCAIAQPAGGLPPQANQRAHDNMAKKNNNNPGAGQAPDPTATVPYSIDFEGEVEEFWSENSVSSLARTGKFLGPFINDQSASLRVATQTGRDYILLFDLLIFDHWEGTARGADVDQMRVEVNDARVFSHQFSTGTNAQTFDQQSMWLATYENLGYSGTRDLWMRDVRVPFRATDTISVLKFYANLFADNAAESWGIDNVRVVSADAYAEPQGGLHVEWFGKFPRTQKADFATESSADFVTRERQIAWLPTSGIVHPSLGADDIAWRTYGGLVVPRTGNWQFRLSSDDGSVLRINDKVIIDNDGDHGWRAVAATIELKQGTHALDVRIYERGGTVGLLLEWRGPGDSNWTVVPPDSFAYLGSPAPVTFTDISDSAGLGSISGLGQIGLIVADLDGDGHQDLVFGGIEPHIFFNNSNNTFEMVQLDTFMFNQHALVDMDNDGDLDLWSGQSGLIENLGGRKFRARGYPSAPTVSAFSLAPADFDGDGWPDLAMTWGSKLITARSLGRASTVEPVEFDASGLDKLFVRVPRPAYAGNFADIDMNGDGTPDLLHASNQRGLWYYESSDSGYSATKLVNGVTKEDWILANASVGDYTNNGELDIFYSLDPNAKSVGLLRQSEGRFTNAIASLPRITEYQWVGADWGDVTNNGHLDLLVWSFYDHKVRLYLNNGDGTFTPRVTIPETVQYPVDARFVDIDNDGDLDIVISGFFECALWRNDLDDGRGLSVRLVGAGDRATNVAAIGSQVLLIDPKTESVIARRDVTSSRGVSGAGPLQLHFGGVDPEREYIVRARFTTGVVEQRVVPAAAVTVIGGSKFASMLTIEEPVQAPGRRIARWREANQEQAILAALRSEARRRGLGERLNQLIAAGADNQDSLLRLLGAKTVRDALGKDAPVLRDLTQGPAE
ncbi:MAG: VCBS repeat-containing protein [Phycisphaeraceae bacterium]|nr:VCBS repeat-containing protein [Phycisphaeraceae bacterium]MCW5761862.1 VCBS repeat-containing protein [Phycisphaeraceae bacterium]